ncbi:MULTISPECIES: DNA polymerase III subunit chi [Thiomicrorhabdus]|uniref:DNA polymerase III subunit chi n=1 Tax=Thiomicrorhabdus heinhorstiae TaxID=2748010 RepID=A0ABS0BWA2_9GAMM|nr:MULTISPECIES: DNA polymerase III subunit chi [Thiomicrorhabdus]MBF6057254.1 DNA polymerase III subunit chi [Thiomicrorhabdus heinhorstiae]
MSGQQDVLFYVLNSHLPQEREAFLHKLVNKIWQERRQCDVRFETLDDARRYDLALWDFKPQSFIPHGIGKHHSSIRLYDGNIAESRGDVLINLHPQFFDNFKLYRRTIEVLDQSEYLIQMGRERWKAYKQHGIQPTVHKIGF